MRSQIVHATPLYFLQSRKVVFNDIINLPRSLTFNLVCHEFEEQMKHQLFSLLYSLITLY